VTVGFYTTEPGTQLTGGGQRVKHPPADRLDGIERLGDVGEQDLRVVVLLVGRHPRPTTGAPSRLGPEVGAL